MLLYASLFLLCVAVSCVMIWMFRSLKEVGTAVYHAFLPSGKGNARTKRLTHLSSHLDSTPTPWGWDSTSTGERAKPVHQANDATPNAPIPWGWHGNAHNTVAAGSKSHSRQEAEWFNRSNMVEKVRNTIGISDPGAKQPDVGWPYRQENFDFAGSTYSYKSKPRPKSNEQKKNAKPWGW